MWNVFHTLLSIFLIINWQCSLLFGNSDSQVEEIETAQIREPLTLPCPVGWMPYEHKCFTFLRDLATSFKQARIMCTRLGANFGTAVTRGEQDFLYSLGRIFTDMDSYGTAFLTSFNMTMSTLDRLNQAYMHKLMQNNTDPWAIIKDIVKTSRQMNGYCGVIRPFYNTYSFMEHRCNENITGVVVCEIPRENGDDIINTRSLDDLSKPATQAEGCIKFGRAVSASYFMFEIENNWKKCAIICNLTDGCEVWTFLKGEVETGKCEMFNTTVYKVHPRDPRTEYTLLSYHNAVSGNKSCGRLLNRDEEFLSSRIISFNSSMVGEGVASKPVEPRMLEPVFRNPEPAFNSPVPGQFIWEGNHFEPVSNPLMHRTTDPADYGTILARDGMGHTMPDYGDMSDPLNLDCPAINVGFEERLGGQFADNMDECPRECVKEKHCFYWTYLEKQRLCFFFAKNATVNFSEGHYSGTIRCRPDMESI